MKNFLNNIWDRVMHLESTTIGLLVSAGLFCFLVYALKFKMASFAEISGLLMCIIPFVFGALFKPKDNQPPNYPQIPTI